LTSRQPSNAGSTLNRHLHFHCVLIDGVFDSAAAGGVIFRAATGSISKPSPKCKSACAGGCCARLHNGFCELRGHHFVE
jgi:hypothetical protein